MYKLLATLIFACHLAIAGAQSPSELKVTIQNIKELKGSMMIALYDDEELFLTKEVRSADKAIGSDTIEFVFSELKMGRYAVSVFHDENDNGKLDANFMGVPSEPYAFSNNAKGLFGPPSFEQCVVVLDKESKQIIISL